MPGLTPPRLIDTALLQPSVHLDHVPFQGVVWLGSTRPHTVFGFWDQAVPFQKIVLLHTQPPVWFTAHSAHEGCQPVGQSPALALPMDWSQGGGAASCSVAGDAEVGSVAASTSDAVNANPFHVLS